MSTLPSYFYQPATPPSEPAEQLEGSAQSQNSFSSFSYRSLSTSPADSINTRLSSPARSPARSQGPLLLPKIRSQDQSLLPGSAGGPRRHRKALSTASNPPGYSPYPPRTPYQIAQRCATEPLECVSLLSPAFTSATPASRPHSGLNSPISLTSSHSRNSSSSSAQSHSHSRSTSAGSSINDYILRKFAYPTYRQAPTYNAPGQNQSSPNYSSNFSGALNIGSVPIRTLAQPLAHTLNLPSELRYSPLEEVSDASTTTLMAYLTSPTQPLHLVPRASVPNPKSFSTWWDIRNLVPWDDFNLSAIYNIPDLIKILNFPIRDIATPAVTIPSSRLQPISEDALTTLCRDIYGTRVNAALKITQGENHHLKMHIGTMANDGPQFLATYTHDIEKTMSGLARGHVVGLVKSFDQWNTGMRHEDGINQVKYLSGLSQLHSCMREHSCRYGFILTEIELICVRAGTEEVPYFGYLEISAPISNSTHSGSSSPDPFSDVTIPSLTTTLALWYLLTLAKDVPLPGQKSWRLDVGSAGTMTRQRVLGEKDAWIGEPKEFERRRARRERGWVWPGDPWNKKEGRRRWRR
ncbi:MAG: hypothetical protein M1834_000696 [Cirrosporium novae-zelandiae]|nr:MAG: hypothetical protein M1834_000696 [Cirrosporium novae-zelandiae]